MRRQKQHPAIRRAIRVIGTQELLGRALRRRQTYISKLLNLEVPISFEIAVGIHHATKGKVPASELLPAYFPKGSVVPPPISSRRRRNGGRRGRTELSVQT